MAEEVTRSTEYESARGATPSKAEAKKILEIARQKFKDCVENESEERKNQLDDLRFCTLDQWPAHIRNERENDIENGPRPCLTIDKINQYIVQVTNDMRQGKPGIVIRPQDDKADVETAKIIKGIIRNIEDQSNADIAYACAGESAVKIGLGYWRVVADYVSPDSFDQDLFIRAIPNTFSVYLGYHSMPDGSDARHGFILESVPMEKFKAQYPRAKYGKDSFDDVDKDQLGHWRTENTITVAEYYYIERMDDVLYFLIDGSTMLKSDYDKWPVAAGEKLPVIRERPSYREQLRWCKITGAEVLEKRDLPGKFIPIIEVVGREGLVDGKRVLWGLVRPAKDSLRMYNYFASTVTEKMGLAPKAPFIGAKGQFKGVEDKWKKANRINYAYLEYEAMEINGNAVPAPERQGPTPMEAALLSQMQVIEHDVQTSLGIFKAGIGESESQQSGKAILALQKESDTGTYHFGANLGVSIRHTGRVLLDLIPHYYDTKRIVRIIGDDDMVQTAEIDPDQQAPMQQVQGEGGMKNVYNPTIGKYDVTITVGPSYNTKRMEAAATFVELARSTNDPGTAAVMNYLTVRNSDFSGSEEATPMLRALLPPAVQQAAGNQADTAQRLVQAEAVMEQMNAQMQEMGQEIQDLKAGVQSDIAKIEANKEAKLVELEAERQINEAKLQLAREEAMAQIELKRVVAEAELEIEQMKVAATTDGTNEAAIQKVISLADKTMIKVQAVFDKETAKLGAEREQGEEDSSDASAEVGKLQQDFLQAVQMIVDGLKGKKQVSMTMPDGRTANATVTMQ